MGRGRAKAKQTRVARELKYHSGGTDLDRLRAELAGDPVTRPAEPVTSDTDDAESDEYADPYAEDDEADETDEIDELDAAGPDGRGQDHRTA